MSYPPYAPPPFPPPRPPRRGLGRGWLLALLIGVPLVAISIIVMAISDQSLEHQPGYKDSYQWGYSTAGPEARERSKDHRDWHSDWLCGEVFGDSRLAGELPDQWNRDAAMAGCQNYLGGQ